MDVYAYTWMCVCLHGFVSGCVQQPWSFNNNTRKVGQHLTRRKYINSIMQHTTTSATTTTIKKYIQTKNCCRQHYNNIATTTTISTTNK